MALRDDLKSYVKCEITLADNEAVAESDIGAVYNAKVININNDDTIDLSIPTYLDEKVELQRGTRYCFHFMRDQSLKISYGVFLQRIRIDNVPMAKIKLVTPIHKIQRRDYYRVPCRVDTIFQVIRLRPEDFKLPNYMEKVAESLDDDRWNNGTILDISGGGVKFISEAPIMDLPYISMSFKLKINGKFKLVAICGKILSRQPVPRTLLCTYRVKFEPEHSKAQDDIIAFVYALQTEMVKREQD